tara:strand:+ start:557 stop:850 length:294 start_codon:yes stop_codon:yes gene_type:complete
MAITKTIEVDKIEIIGEHKALQVRTATIIKEDGAELNRSFSRKVLHPGILDASDNLVDTDVSAEDADVKAVATAVWSDAVKTAWKNKLIADKAGPGA